MSPNRFALSLCSVFVLTGCGQAQDIAQSFNKVSDACAGSAMPSQFVVKHVDNSIEVVRAKSEADFINGYMRKNADTIQYAEHDFFVHAEIAQTESSNTASITADNWGPVKVEADKLWSQNVRGDNITVAVIDTGMDVTHPQLQSQLAINPGEYGPDSKGGRKENNGIDDDGNGYVDDYAGMDFSGDSQSPPVPPHPLTGDNQYHGTHVSGIIAAHHTDTVAGPQPYIEGLAPNAKLLPLAFLGTDGSGSMSSAVMAIRYAVSRGARVINASWGGSDCLQSLKDEIASLASQNVIFVTAAGNGDSNGVGYDIDTQFQYPASLNLPSQLTVGATGDHDYKAIYSNYGAKTVHIFAPGTNIVSTLPGGQMGFLSGTSMATPFVSGAVALLLSAVPTATPDQIRAALYNSAFHDTSYVNASQGRLDLASALTELHKIIGN